MKAIRPRTHELRWPVVSPRRRVGMSFGSEGMRGIGEERVRNRLSGLKEE